MAIEITWEKYELLAQKIASSIVEKDFDQIVGISRSGLILGVHLAHLLEIRKFGCIEVLRTYTDEENADKQIPQITYWANIDNTKGKKILLVDDIVGEGKTLRIAKSKLEEFEAEITTCVLVVNLNNFKDNDLESLVNYYGEAVRGWVSFPWCK